MLYQYRYVIATVVMCVFMPSLIIRQVIGGVVMDTSIKPFSDASEVLDNIRFAEAVNSELSNQYGHPPRIISPRLMNLCASRAFLILLNEPIPPIDSSHAVFGHYTEVISLHPRDTEPVTVETAAAKVIRNNSLFETIDLDTSPMIGAVLLCTSIHCAISVILGAR